MRRCPPMDFRKPCSSAPGGWRMPRRSPYAWRKKPCWRGWSGRPGKATRSRPRTLARTPCRRTRWSASCPLSASSRRILKESKENSAWTVSGSRKLRSNRQNLENQEGFFMLRSIMIAAAAAGLLAVGALSAVAGNSHGKAVSTLATSTTLKGDAISTLASAKGEAKSDAAKADAEATAADTDADDTDEATSDSDAHGDAVSAVAKSDATAAHTTGNKTVNHGGAVSVVARDHDK